MKLSIVICLYNTDRHYFENCLSSIKNSTLSSDCFEILVIDDGSSEDYSDLIQTYGARTIKTENHGIFRARLLGISEAKGEYIAFVDSDDTVSVNYHFPMLKEAEKSNSDIIFNDWAFHTERTKYYCKKDTTISTDFIYEGEDILPAFAKNEGREHSYFVLWNKLFSAKLLKDSVPFLEPIANRPERFNYSEDTLICFAAMSRAKRIANIHTGYYFYRIHSSQTVNVVSEERLKSHVMNMSETFDIMMSNIESHPKKEDIGVSFKKWRELMSRTHYSYAKANKYIGLFDLIKKRYYTDKLEKSKFRDNSAYSNNKVLPYNFAELEEFILRIYRASKPICIDLRKSCNYVRKSVTYLSLINANISFDDNGIAPPEARIKLKDKIIMNKFVYSLGLVLFKKGSKLRAFLKKHI